VQAAKKSFKETSALACPLIQTVKKERRIQLCQPYPTLISRLRDREPKTCTQPLSYTVKQRLNEGPELRIGCCPIALGMRCDRLAQMSRWNI
jgi:hypothetical protein